MVTLSLIGKKVTFCFSIVEVCKRGAADPGAGGEGSHRGAVRAVEGGASQGQFTVSCFYSLLCPYVLFVRVSIFPYVYLSIFESVAVNIFAYYLSNVTLHRKYYEIQNGWFMLNFFFNVFFFNLDVLFCMVIICRLLIMN